MRQFGFIALLSLTALLATGQIPPRVQKSSDIGNDASSVPRPGYLRPNWDGTNLKFRDANNVLRSLADLVGPISTTGTGGISQTAADNRYRLKTDGITYNELTTGKPTDLSAFGNSPGYQTGTQVTAAITAALASRLTQTQADGLYRKLTDPQLASTISNFSAAARAAITVTGTGASYNPNTGELVFTAGSGGSSLTQAQIRAMFSPGGGLLYDVQNGQFYIKISDINTYVDNRIRSYDGYAAGRVLVADNANGFTWTTATTGGSSTTTAPVAPTPYDSILVYADSTKNRFNASIATVVNLHTSADIHAFMSTSQTNKDGVVDNGVYNNQGGSGGAFVQSGAWNNVRLRPQTTGGVTLTTVAGQTVALAIVGTAQRTKVCYTGIKFKADGTGSGYPIVFSNEEVPFVGLEFGFCEFTSNGLGTYNAYSIFQYSSGSNSGADAQDLYFHNNYVHDNGRAGNEILCQGYDRPRLKNLVFANNRYQNNGLNDQHGFGISLSGLIKYVFQTGNVIINCKNIGLEYVNAQYCVARNNTILNDNTAILTNGVGISDDGVGTTRYLYIENTTVDVQGRPFYNYDSKYVYFTGGTWKGRYNVDTKAKYCSYKSMNVTVWEKSGTGNIWVVDNTSTNNLFQDLTLTSRNSVPNGATSVHETLVLRGTANNNTLTNITTIIGQQADGSYFNSGAILNQGTGNVITNNVFSQAPNN